MLRRSGMRSDAMINKFIVDIFSEHFGDMFPQSIFRIYLAFTTVIVIVDWHGIPKQVFPLLCFCVSPARSLKEVFLQPKLVQDGFQWVHLKRCPIRVFNNTHTVFTRLRPFDMQTCVAIQPPLSAIFAYFNPVRLQACNVAFRFNKFSKIHLSAPYISVTELNLNPRQTRNAFARSINAFTSSMLHAAPRSCHRLCGFSSFSQ